MTLKRKLTTILIAILTTFCVIFALSTLRPANAFAASENDVIRFDSTVRLTKLDGVLTEDGYSNEFLGFNLRYNDNFYNYENYKIEMRIGLYAKSNILNGLGEADQNVTYSALTNNKTFKCIEAYDITLKYRYKPDFWTFRETSVEYRDVEVSDDMKNYLYISNYTAPETITLKSYLENVIHAREWGAYGASLTVLGVRCADPYVDYAIGVSYALTEKGSDTVYHTSVSPVTSLACHINKRIELNAFDNEEEATLYTDLYNNYVTQRLTRDITIEYLEPLFDTPFATRVSKKITITLNKDGTITAPGVCAQMGLKRFQIFNTVYNGINKISDTLYRVSYPQDLLFTAKTVDGKDITHFLSINESYEEYFGTLRTRGVISQGAYESLFANAVGNVYPELAENNYFYGEVYGYWAYIALPKTYTINNLIKTLTLSSTNYKGILEKVEYSDILTKEGYTSLLNDYGYGWVGATWNTIFASVDTCSATHYLIICDQNEKKNGGVDDTSGGVATKLNEFFNEISNFFTGKGPAGTYIIIVVIGAGVLFAMYLKNNNFNFTNKTKSKPKTKTKSKPRPHAQKRSNYGSNKKKR